MHSGLCCMLKIVYWPQPSSDNDNCYTEYFMFWPVALLMLLQQLLTLMYLMWLLRRISLMLALIVLQGKTFSSKHLLCVLFLSWFLWCLWSILCLTYMLPFSWYVWELYYVFLCLAIFLLWSVSLVSSRSWLLSGKLAKMLLIDCEQNDSDCSLTTAGIFNHCNTCSYR